ncbi:MAG: flagellar basal body-associated FliL family protein [Oscillospiraceae bacterium]|jgi:flagellar basal body-associated protein FliL|nr:flagellar basal body-associated FliL family protein [Oscillospiraceae bacterium]
MGRKIAALCLLAVMAMTLLASCGEKAEAYTGQKNVNFSFDEPFIANVSDEPRQYVKCAIMLEISDEKLLEELTAKQHRIRGFVYDLIGARTNEQVRDIAEKSTILAEFIALANAEFNTDAIVAAYFTEFTPVRQ